MLRVFFHFPFSLQNEPLIFINISTKKKKKINDNDLGGKTNCLLFRIYESQFATLLMSLHHLDIQNKYFFFLFKHNNFYSEKKCQHSNKIHLKQKPFHLLSVFAFALFCFHFFFAFFEICLKTNEIAINYSFPHLQLNRISLEMRQKSLGN